jgi:hypothetical protein
MKKLSVLTVLFALSGCLPPVVVTQDSKVARGEAFTVGESKYDAFFQRVYDAQARVKEIDAEAPLRQVLAEGLGLASGAARDQLLEGAKERAALLNKSGGYLKVQFVPQAKLTSKTTDSKTGGLAKSIDEILHKGTESADELSGLAVQMTDLEKEVDSLMEGVDAAFSEPAKRDDVKRELHAARSEIERSRLKASAESGRALAFLLAVARAVDNGEGPTEVAQAPAKARPNRPWAGKPAGKAKPKEDFDP